mmetsp:Transcript_37990/g.100481  ORF Transcript_37990/g.100481 Transcript_37990/m.100481 type:complete len:330 (+) Transcript_37990:156-1145(+)
MAESHAAHILSLIVVLAAITADIGWVLTVPAVGVPFMLAALAAQVGMLCVMRRKGECIGAYDWALSFWIFGSSVWMFSEYLWDSGLHVAAFADRLTGDAISMWPSMRHGQDFHSLDVAFQADILQNQKLYPAAMGMACLTLWITFATLIVFMMVEWVLRQRAGKPKEPRCEDTVFGMPMDVYCDIWFLPWLLMEACWVLNNLQMVLHMKVRPVFWFGVAGGLVALVLCADCVRRYVERRRHNEAVLCSAHLAWSAGNLAWYVFDVERADGWETAQVAPVALFVIALACLALSSLMDKCPESTAAKALLCKVPAKASNSEREPLLAKCGP